MKPKRTRVRPTAADPDNPELTRRDVALMRPAQEVLPDVVAAYRRGRGRPRQAQTKQLVSLRLSPDVLAHFRNSGPGWQTRIDEALRSHVRRQRPAARPVRRAATPRAPRS